MLDKVIEFLTLIFGICGMFVVSLGMVELVKMINETVEVMREKKIEDRNKEKHGGD